MKKSKLEEFINDNRHAFDEEDPSPANWKAIERNIQNRNKGNRVNLKNFLKWVAAAVIFIGLTSIYFLYIRESPAKTSDDISAGQSTLKDNGQIPSLYNQESQQIFKSIADRRQALKKISDDQPALYAQFTHDLAALDSAYNLLRQEAISGNNQEVILEAMLQNLRLQAALLGKQLSIIQQFSPNKNKANEKDNYRRI